jgi:hypothetical protein
MIDTDLEVRHAIYEHFVTTGEAPTVAGLASTLGPGSRDIVAALQRLFERRLLVLASDREQILMAPPFSGVPTQHRVIVGGREYFANCAWDALGIVAALHRDGLVRSRCEQSLEPLDIAVHAAGPDPVPCVIHFAVPASLWWRDIVFT